MIYSEYLMRLVEQVNGLIYFLPFCETQKDMDSITLEIYNIRRRIVAIEDMTETERTLPLKIIKMEIESIGI